MGNKGQVYEKGWDGEYRPKEGLFGAQEAEVKTSLLTGEPEPVRDWAGNQVRASDGSPLYKGGGTSTEDAAAAGLAGLVIVVALAVLAAAAWLFAKVVRWWWPRMRAAARQDVEARRISLDSVGLWLPAVGFSAGFFSSFARLGMSPAGWLFGLLFLAAFLEVVAYAGLHLVEAVMELRSGQSGARPVVGWGLAVGFLCLMAVNLIGGSSATGALGSVIGLGMLASLGAGGVWGAQGRPDWVAQTSAGLASASASAAAPTEHISWGEPPLVTADASSAGSVAPAAAAPREHVSWGQPPVESASATADTRSSPAPRPRLSWGKPAAVTATRSPEATGALWAVASAPTADQGADEELDDIAFLAEEDRLPASPVSAELVPTAAALSVAEAPAEPVIEPEWVQMNEPAIASADAAPSAPGAPSPDAAPGGPGAPSPEMVAPDGSVPLAPSSEPQASEAAPPEASAPEPAALETIAPDASTSRGNPAFAPPPKPEFEAPRRPLPSRQPNANPEPAFVPFLDE